MTNDKFSKPLNQWIEEEVPVTKNRINPKTGKVTSVVQLEKVRTKYIESIPKLQRCSSGEHIFKCVDQNRYIFSCIKCSYSRQVYPTTYKFENGKLIHRYTGVIV